jgi:Uma2 family endonuclease
MANVLETRTDANAENLSLRNGDRMSQPEFHRLYQTVPPRIRIELIDGIVSMNAAAMKMPHSDYVRELITQAGLYCRRTQGVHCGAGATVILDGQNEPEPDCFLRLLPGFGGSSRNSVPDGSYIQGPPELVIEVSDRSLFRDLNQKKDAYQHAGVQEYIVVCVERCEIKWFHWPVGEREIPHEKILKSVMFPGFWLDIEALFRLDGLKLEEVLFAGLKTPEYATFKAELQKRKSV